MSSRVLPIVAGLLAVLAIVEGVMLWQLSDRRSMASIELRATNAGLELGAEDGRVFVHMTEPSDRLVAEGSLEEAIPLQPGTYDIRVVFSRSKDHQSEWLRGIALNSGERATHEVEFTSGELKVETSVGGGSGEVVVYVFNQQDHDRIVTSMRAGEPVLISPGIYDLRVVLTSESKEKDIRWRNEVPVQAGLQTRVKVQFQRGSLNLVARNGQQLLPTGAVELTVYRAGDLQREVVDSGLAGSPLHLAVGRYDIKATFTASNDKPSIWLRGLEIAAEDTLERQVAFSSGTAVVRAEIKDGEPLEDFQAYVYYYPAGNHQQPVTYAPAPEPVVLASGRYDVRVSYYRSHDQPDLWIRDLIVPAGGRVSRVAVFASGKLLVRAYDPAGIELIGDNVFVRVHAPGETSRPIAVARSGELLTLSEGAYDLVAEDTRSPGAQIRMEDVSVAAGTLSEHMLTFRAP